MGGFLSDLRKKLEIASGNRAPWGDVNPLVVIGLTEAILDLGLTEEQLFASIRSYDRQLAAQVHPDRKPVNVSADRQKQILEAFNFLDSFDNFHLALKDFKTLRADDRREVRILGQAMSALRVQMNSLESQYQTYLINKGQLEVDMRAFEKAKEDEGLRVPELEQNMEIFRREAESKQKLLNAERERSRHWKTRFEHVARYFPLLGNNPIEDSNEVFAFEAQWTIVVGLSSKIGFPDISPLDRQGKIKDNFIKKVSEVGIDEERLLDIIKEWKKASVQFLATDVPADNTLPLGIALIKLTSGRQQVLFGDPLFAKGGQVIGSISAPMHSNERARLRYSVSQESVFESLNPLLVPGNLMVSVLTIPNKKASWSLTCPAFKFATKKVILAVG